MPNRYPGPPRRAAIVGGRRGGEGPHDPGDEWLSEAMKIVDGLVDDLHRVDEGLRAGRVDPGLINEVFRAVHTLKGVAGLCGASRVLALSHEREELLDHLRLGRVELSAEVFDLRWRSAQLCRRILQEGDGSDQPMTEVDALISELRQGPKGPSAARAYDLDPSVLSVLTEYEEHRVRANLAQGLRLYRLRVQFQLETIDVALDELKALTRPHGEIVAYLPAGGDADAIDLDILMASGVTIKALSAVFSGSRFVVEEIALLA